jgi:signal transduction histidine kinase
MERQLYQLMRLTDDLLDVARITSDKIDLRRQRMDLRLALQSAVETTQPLIDAAGHLLSIDLPRDAIWVDADSARMTQAFANLLNNAVKYTERGGRIAIRASVENVQATVTVSDTGIGIAPAALPRIFDMFVQSDNSADRPREGLGIGLTLAKRLIELHAGTIEATSDGPGRGTTFVTRLPLAMALTAAAPPC